MTSEIPHIQGSSAFCHSLPDPNRKYSQYERIRSFTIIAEAEGCAVKNFYVCIYMGFSSMKRIRGCWKTWNVRNGTEQNRTKSNWMHSTDVDLVGNWRHRGADLSFCNHHDDSQGRCNLTVESHIKHMKHFWLGSSTTSGGINTTLLLSSMGESRLRFLPRKRNNHEQRATSTSVIAYWLQLSLNNLDVSCMLYRCLFESEIGLLFYCVTYL